MCGKAAFTVLSVRKFRDNARRLPIAILQGKHQKGFRRKCQNEVKNRVKLNGIQDKIKFQF